MSEKSLKNFLSRLIFTALVGAALAFAYVLFLPKYYQVTGKIVIVPSGSSPTAGANLFAEAGNAAEMTASPGFQKAYLEDQAGIFFEARQIGNSSTLSVSFLSLENDIAATEDALVKTPENIHAYAKEIYGGSPFKYLLLSDPEVSGGPVQPDVYKNILWGFSLGAILYFLYWLMVEDYISQRPEIEEKEALEPEEKSILDFRPDMKEEKEAVSAEEKPKPVAKKIIRPISAVPSAPDNLPVSEEAAPSDFQEPSDEEVKDRLNRLMRGEL